MKQVKMILVITLIFVFISTLNIFAEEVPTSEDDLDSLSQEILENAESIISSQPNVTVATQLLAALPEPKEKIKIAIYDLTDKTGQLQNPGSNVVSQGAVDMMATALMRSRQFIVLDRVNFSNFMNEQALQINERLAANQGPQIGELYGAEYVLSGAVTEYQVDHKTGGLGVVIAGLGGTNQKAVAKAAIDIRVLDATTGEIVWAESLMGEIEGTKSGLQAFTFLGNNIVEFETGKGKQEVINMVIRTLIEEAVFTLVQSNVL